MSSYIFLFSFLFVITKGEVNELISNESIYEWINYIILKIKVIVKQYEYWHEYNTNCD